SRTDVAMASRRRFMRVGKMIVASPFASWSSASPVEQIARHDGRETTQAVWLSPGDALDQEAKGEATIIFPTRMNLRRLAMATSVRDALKRFSADDVVTVLPVVSKMADGEPCLVIPEVDGYGQTEEPLENLKGVAR
ncbi:MAG: hypothetical protein AAFQ84_06730, partial [Pseudomonadota bacterium]